MKLIFFILVLLKNGIKPTEGQLTVLFSSTEIILRIYFDPFYNHFEKSCCKFDETECLLVVNSRGLVASNYQGRLFRANYNGAFDVKITNPSVMDAGIYRCGVNGFPTTYGYVEVTISDLQSFFKVIGINPVSLTPKSSIRPSVKTSTYPLTLLGSENHTEEYSSERKNMVFTLAAVCSVVVFAVIVSSILLVFCLKMWKKKSRNKSGSCGFQNNTPQSPKQEDGITYSMVFFKFHPDPSELYANLQTQSPRHTGPSSTCMTETGESVEYSTIRRAPT